MWDSDLGEATESRDDVRSLADFQSDPMELLAQVQRSHKPLVLTVEDKPAIVVQDAESYRQMQDRLYELEIVQAIQVGLDDLKSGRTVPLEEFISRIENKFGLLR